MDLTLFEVDEAANRIRAEVDPDANILVGSALNPELDGKMRVSVVATGMESDDMPRREEPRKTYSYDKKPEIETKSQTDTTPDAGWDEPITERKSLVETAMDVADKEPVLADVEEAPLELVNEVHKSPLTDKTAIQKETDSLLAQLAEGIVQEPEQVIEDSESSELTARREDPFISAAPVMPEKRMEPLKQQADPFAEAAMANGPVQEEAPQKRGLLGLFSGRRKAAAKKQAISRQPDMLKSEEKIVNPVRQEAVAPEAAQPEKAVSNSLAAEERVKPQGTDAKEDNHLEIPAFLRRQAN